jgi:hypothetical protein
MMASNSKEYALGNMNLNSTKVKPLNKLKVIQQPTMYFKRHMLLDFDVKMDLTQKA